MGNPLNDSFYLLSSRQSGENSLIINRDITTINQCKSELLQKQTSVIY